MRIFYFKKNKKTKSKRRLKSMTINYFKMKWNQIQTKIFFFRTYFQCRAQDEALNMVAIQQVIMAAIVTVTIIVRTVVHHMNHLRAVLNAQPHFVHEKYPHSVQENEWLHRRVCLDDREVQQHIVDEVAFCVVSVVRRHRHRPFWKRNICHWSHARKRQDEWKSLGWGGMVYTNVLYNYFYSNKKKKKLWKLSTWKCGTTYSHWCCVSAWNFT